MRLVQIKNRAAPSELIPGISIRSIKLISNQLDILVVYIASCIPSELQQILNFKKVSNATSAKTLPSESHDLVYLIFHLPPTVFAMK